MLYEELRVGLKPSLLDGFAAQNGMESYLERVKRGGKPSKCKWSGSWKNDLDIFCEANLSNI